MAENLKKIIYFDETSAIDLLQIEKKGNFNQTIELVNEVSGEANGEVKASAAAGKQSAVKAVFENNERIDSFKKQIINGLPDRLIRDNENENKNNRGMRLR